MVLPSNIDAFYEAFAVKPGDRMYRAPERACQNLVKRILAEVPCASCC